MKYKKTGICVIKRYTADGKVWFTILKNITSLIQLRGIILQLGMVDAQII